jgi:serine/threonine protein kinase
MSKTIEYLKREGKRFDIEKIRKIIIELMSGLLFLHENGLAHKNLRPRVICWDKAYQIKITDYAVSTKILGTSNYAAGDRRQSFTLTSSVNKDPQINYKAPELIALGDGIEVNLRDRIDVWSAGCVIYEAISLKKAFDGQNFIEIDNNIKMTEPELDVTKLANKNTIEQWDKIRELLKK